MRNFICYEDLREFRFGSIPLSFANQVHIIEDSLTNKEDNGFHQKFAIR